MPRDSGGDNNLHNKVTNYNVYLTNLMNPLNKEDFPLTLLANSVERKMAVIQKH